LAQQNRPSKVPGTNADSFKLNEFFQLTGCGFSDCCLQAEGEISAAVSIKEEALKRNTGDAIEPSISWQVNGYASVDLANLVLTYPPTHATQRARSYLS
jgi:hypothetical protein